MRNRIVDIEDATQRVLKMLQGIDYEDDLDFFEPTVLIVDKFRPSTLYNCDPSKVTGLISNSGAYNEHACLLIRCKDIPAIIVENIYEIVNDKDKLLIDCNNGRIYINPEIDFLDTYLKERR
jgi:signal transduction protein with GAF and PtsI domain